MGSREVSLFITLGMTRLIVPFNPDDLLCCKVEIVANTLAQKGIKPTQVKGASYNDDYCEITYTLPAKAKK